MVMGKALRDRRGFTLTEALLTVAIVGVLFAIAPRMFIQVNRQFLMTKTRLALQREARAFMYVISRNLHQAQSSTITIARRNSSQPFFSKIVFTKVQGKQMTFEQDGNKLYQIADSTNTLSENIRYLAFTFPRTDDMTILSVSFTLEKEIYEGQTKALHMASEKVRIMN